MPTAANRHDYPNHADVWSLRRNWVNEKARIKLALLAGRFRFGLLDRIPHAHIERLEVLGIVIEIVERLAYRHALDTIAGLDQDRHFGPTRRTGLSEDEERSSLTRSYRARARSWRHHANGRVGERRP